MALRRTVVGMVGGVLLAGCSGRELVSDTQNAESGGADRDGDGVPDSKDDFPSDAEYSLLVESVSEEITLAPGEYKLYGFEVNAPSDLSYEIATRGDGLVDVFLTDESNFRKFENRSKWSYYDDGSELSTATAAVTFTVGTERRYYLVVDNSPEGGATPSTDDGTGRATVEVRIQLKRRS